MTILRAKEFCLWVVSPQDGKVRKLRVTLRCVVLLCLVAAVVVGAFLFVASDYARVQMLRAKNFLHLKLVSAQRDELLAVRHNLESRVQSLQSENDRVAKYEKQVKERMEALASLLRSVDALPSKATPANKQQSKPGSAGLGGAELLCEGFDEQGRVICRPAELRKSSLLPLVISPAQTAGTYFTLAHEQKEELFESHSEPEGAMLELLEHYTDVLRTVPFGMPAQGRLDSGFGLRESPFGEGLTMHEGVDLSLPLGSVIAATANGRVKEVRYCYTYGLMIDILHNNRILTRYAHLQKALVRPGQMVERGEVIGLSGSTGRSTGPHLHYEVRINGQPRNPVRYIELASKLGRIFG